MAVDAVHGFGEELFLEIKLWNRSLQQIASESLYADEEPVEEPVDQEPVDGDSADEGSEKT